MQKQNEPQSIPKLVQKRVIPATRSEVFDAWTKPEIMRQWMAPGNWSAESENDLRVGGHFKQVMIDDGSGMKGIHEGKVQRLPHTGEYLEIKSPERLVFTWNSHMVQNSRVTIELQDLGDSTELTLTHEFLLTEENHKAHTQGWSMILDRLAALLKK